MQVDACPELPSPCVRALFVSSVVSDACGYDGIESVNTRYTEYDSARHSLLLVDRLELNSFIAVLSTTSGATAVEVLLDMVPAKPTYLLDSEYGGRSESIQSTDLVTARAGLEVYVGDVHFLET